MTHDELLEEINFLPLDGLHAWMQPALRALVELHNNYYGMCMECELTDYPCPTIQAIEKELE